MKILRLVGLIAMLSLAFSTHYDAQSDEEHFVALSSFSLDTFRHFQSYQDMPSLAPEILLRMRAGPGLQVVVVYTGNLRTIPQEKRREFGTFLEKLDDPKFAAAYEGQELEVQEFGISYWLPVQTKLIPLLSQELSTGQEMTVFVRGWGLLKAPAEFEYMLVDFDPVVKERLPRATCFTRALAGLQLGMPLDQAQAQLANLYGEVKEVHLRNSRSFYFFQIDAKTDAQIILGNGGAGFENRLHSIQMIGPKQLKGFPDFNGLQLGSKASVVRKILGRPDRIEPSEKGYIQWNYPNTPCSVEFKKGRLASVLISEDPYYFGD